MNSKNKKLGLLLSVLIFLAKAREREKELVVIIPSYNNQEYCVKGLKSVLDQEYNNYQVIFINDASTDNTLSLAQAYVKKQAAENKVTFINNKKRRGMLSNVYCAVHSLPDHKIVGILDGDDHFTDNQVFSYINHIYTKYPIWMSYGGYQEYPSGKPGFCIPVPEEIVKTNNFRNCGKITSQLRTSYAGLFKQVKLEDLLYKGKFFMSAGDIAYFYPMFEMAGDRFKFVKKPIYQYNRQNPLNDDKVNLHLQELLGNIVKSKPKYQKITNFIREKSYEEKITIVILEESKTVNRELLNQIKNFVSDTDKVYIINSLEQLNQIRKLTSSSYIFLLSNKASFKQPLVIKNLIAQLIEHHAFAFCFWNKDPIYFLPYESLNENIYAFQFKEWAHKLAPELMAVLLKQEDFFDLINSLYLSNHQELLKNLWSRRLIFLNKVGLFSFTSAINCTNLSNKKNYS